MAILPSIEPTVGSSEILNVHLFSIPKCLLPQYRATYGTPCCLIWTNHVYKAWSRFSFPHGFNLCVFELAPPSKAFTILSLLLALMTEYGGHVIICGYIFVWTSTFDFLYRFILLFQRFRRNLSLFSRRHRDKVRGKEDNKIGNGDSFQMTTEPINQLVK